MIQRRKKDYLQRLIEEFFSRLQKMYDNADTSLADKRLMMDDCFQFFQEHLNVCQSDKLSVVIEKINDYALLEQYAKLLLTRYEIVDIKNIDQLQLALDIVRYIEVADKTYSWDRAVLREDILRMLDRNNDIE